MDDDWGTALASAWEGLAADSAAQNAAMALPVLSNSGTGFDFAGVFRNVTDPIVSLAKTVGDFQLQRDALQAAADDRAFNRYAKGVQLDIARDQLGIGASLEKLKAQTQLALAQRNAAALVSTGGMGTILLLVVIGLVAWKVIAK